jgi:IS4 transposase
MSHKTDIGYELQSTLLVSDRDGSPLVSPVQNLVTANGVLSSRNKEILREDSDLNELTNRMQWLEGQSFGKKLIHIVDREADSVRHLRQWSVSGSSWLIRVKEGSTVNYDGFNVRLSDVANDLTYREIGKVIYKGKPARHSIASTQVVLTRKAKSKKEKEDISTPLCVKLIVSRIHDANGQQVAQWCLLADVAQTVDDATLARWYYYRWNIESYFKLLKQAGHQLERWEQETGSAAFKRLLIVAQASH